MNNKPVAWGMTWKDGEIYDVISPAQHAKEEGDYTVPLYTHPVNITYELTMEKCRQQQARIKELEKCTTAYAGFDPHENHEWDRGDWTVGQTESQEFIESSDFNHDVRLYLNGDFEDDTQRLNYLQHIADRLNTHPIKELNEQFKKGFEAGKKEGWKAHKFHHPVKELTDEEWNKAFDFYCETDEGVLRFDLELRDEWKKEQLIRWKEALRKASEK